MKKPKSSLVKIGDDGDDDEAGGDGCEDGGGGEQGEKVGEVCQIYSSHAGAGLHATCSQLYNLYDLLYHYLVMQYISTYYVGFP